jgi:hypothetical protein
LSIDFGSGCTRGVTPERLGSASTFFSSSGSSAARLS